LLGDLDRQGFHPIDIDTDLPAEDLEGSFVLQLIDVTALFAGGLVIGGNLVGKQLKLALRQRPTLPVPRISFNVVDELTDTERGANGFGTDLAGNREL
jgi:hypothetical protein